MGGGIQIMNDGNKNVFQSGELTTFLQKAAHIVPLFFPVLWSIYAIKINQMKKV